MSFSKHTLLAAFIRRRASCCMRRWNWGFWHGTFVPANNNNWRSCYLQCFSVWGLCLVTRGGRGYYRFYCLELWQCCSDVFTAGHVVMQACRMRYAFLFVLKDAYCDALYKILAWDRSRVWSFPVSTGFSVACCPGLALRCIGSLCVKRSLGFPMSQGIKLYIP